ncbi:MAG: DUF5011 domain-containing protein [Myxococcaceae bacterium]|nr:DUF5011 domain-containing protein [Myxococcaceae bacterium]
MKQLCKACLSLGMLLGLGACGVEEPQPEASGDQRATGLQAPCKVLPPFIPHFEPVSEWAWTGSPLLSEHKQVMTTPIVADVNGDGIGDLVFNAYRGTSSAGNGVLRAISGANGQDLWVASSPTARVRGTAGVAAADIDHDGWVELCTLPEIGIGILCFEHDGRFKFRTMTPSRAWGAISFADLEGDGDVEILHGGHVFKHTGALKWAGSDTAAAPSSFAADIDQDGLQEVIQGRTIYRHDGTIKCRNPQIGNGLAGAGNFDQDPRGEIVVVWSGNVTLMDDDCSRTWTVALPGGGKGGAPTIADFDQDGQPEIGVAGATRYVVFEANGAVKWERAIADVDSGVSGATAFDFEGDGQVEVIHADESSLRIYDGATGMVRFEAPHPSAVLYESPIVADVDGDGSAEIVVASNSTSLSGPAGLRVYGDSQNGWVNTRRIWNQQAYGVVNIEEDGSVPPHPDTNWNTPGLNTFRANLQLPGVTLPVPGPDLVISEVMAACHAASERIMLQATVHNQGEAEAAAGLPVAFYEGDPETGGALLGVGSLAEALPAGMSATVTLMLSSVSRRTVELFAVIDDDGTGAGSEVECREDNNTISATVAFSCNAPPVAVCQAVTVAADPLTCLASASVDGGSYDPDGLPAPLVISESPTGDLGPGSHAVTLVASDGESTRSCVGSVTVVDDTPPVLTLVGAPVVSLECGGTLPLGVVASDACHGDLTSQVEVLGLNTNRPGFYAVTHQVKDQAGNTTVGALRWVTIRDSFSPTLVLNGDSVMTLECGVETWVDPGAVATDSCSGELEVHRYNSGQDPYGPGPNTTAEGRYSVQYIAWDEAGHTQSAVRVVWVKDRRAPTLVLEGPPRLTHPCGSAWVDPGVKAKDECYTHVASSVIRKGWVNGWREGTYTVRYELRDGAGNQAAPVTRTVEVVDCPW